MFKVKLPIIYLSGIITSVITMFIIFMVAQNYDFNLLGFYVWIFPIGAFAAGMASGSGYLLCSRKLKVKRGKLLAVSVGIITFAIYFFFHYLVYLAAGGDKSISAFISYTLDSASNSSLIIGKSHRSTVDNVGYVGYGFLVLECIGYIVGSVVVALPERETSITCEACKKYYRRGKENFCYMPPLIKLHIDGVSESEKSSQIAANTAQLHDELAKVREAVKGMTLKQTLEYLKSLAKKSSNRTNFYMKFVIESCPRCGDHDILIQLFLNSNKNNEIVTTNEPPIINRRNA
jgi:hypothetical protein